MSAEVGRAEIAMALSHGYEIDPSVGGVCPACDRVYFEKRPGAYMDPDLDWLRGAIQEHRINMLAEYVATKQAQALREAGGEALDVAFGSNEDVRDWLLDCADRIAP